MLGSLKQALSRNEAAAIAGGIAIGLAVYSLAQAIVFGLIAPLIAVFVGDSRFELNSFTISGSDFRYGLVIQYALAFALVSIAVLSLFRWSRRSEATPSAATTRSCPECTSSISAQARRCPYCTAAIEPQAG